MKKFSLENIGLNKNEAQIYESLLEHGELTPSEIAVFTGLTRENSYNVARSLITKGLVEQVPRKKKITYRPLSPEKLKEYVKMQKAQLETEEDILDRLMPELTSLYALSANRPDVSVFHGTDGIKKIYENLYHSDKSEEVLIFRSLHDTVLGVDLLEHVKKLTRKGIHSRLIGPAGDTMSAELDGIKLDREMRYLPADRFSLPAEISITKTKVVLVSLKKDKLGVVVESSDLAESLSKIFEILWDKAK